MNMQNTQPVFTQGNWIETSNSDAVCRCGCYDFPHSPRGRKHEAYVEQAYRPAVPKWRQELEYRENDRRH